MFLKPFLEFKFYLILMYILIYISAIHDKIYFYCLPCVVVFTTDKKKKFSTMSIGKIPRLIRFGRVHLTDTISPS